MLNKKSIVPFLFLLFVCSINTFAADSLQVWVKKTVSPQTIYYEGAGGGDTATVTVRAWASKDSITLGQPVDVLFLTDNSGSMILPKTCYTTDWAKCPRLPIGYSAASPISRIQGTYNACATFIDSILNINDRAAHMRFSAIVDTPVQYSADFAQIKSKMDTAISANEMVKTTVNGRDTSIQGDGTAVYTGILKAVRYMANNRRSGTLPVLIALTDGSDNASGSFGSQWNTNNQKFVNFNLGAYPNLGSTLKSAVDSVVKIIDSLKNAGVEFKLFTVALGTSLAATDLAYLDTIARHGNTNSVVQSTDGAGLESVFQNIGQKIYTAVAIKVSPSIPMYEDVLAKNIHYVPNSYKPHSGNSYPSENISGNFTFSSITGLNSQVYDKLSISLDTIKVAQVLEFEYKITAALRDYRQTAGIAMFVSNYKSDDSLAYSKLQYRNLKDSTREQSIFNPYVIVKSKITGISLSTNGSLLKPPDTTGSKTLTLSFSTMRSDSFGPVNLYALTRYSATGVYRDSALSAYWSFAPLTGWTMFAGTAMDYSQAPIGDRLIGLTVRGDSSLQGSDTLRIKSVDGRFSDQLVFRAVYADSPYVADYRMSPITPTSAGNPITVTWSAVDIAGKIVSDTSLTPDNVCIYSTKPVKIIRGPGDTVPLNAGSDKICFDHPFHNGQMSIQVYSTLAESLSLSFVITNNNIDSIKQANLLFTPNSPYFISMRYTGDTSRVEAISDTLSTFGSENVTQRAYSAFLFDRFGNPITDPAILQNLRWNAVHANGNLSLVSSDAATYKTLNSEGNFQDTIYVSYNENNTVLFRDSVFVLVVPIVQVRKIITHEWAPKLPKDSADIRFVIDSVLHLSTDSLKTYARNQNPQHPAEDSILLATLQSAGYGLSRDGYLDYLDIEFSMPILMKTEFITRIFFDTLFSGRKDSIVWPLTRLIHDNIATPKLTALNYEETRYRLWLIPNTAVSSQALETGFLPSLRFDNDAIQGENILRLRIGTADNEFITSSSIVIDSAPPVIDRFIYQNNQCDPDKKLNTARITFSEPVIMPPGSFVGIRSFALLNGTVIDTLFMLTSIQEAEVIHEQLNAKQAWNLEDVPGATMTYELAIRADHTQNFRENITKIRFSVDSSLNQIVDASGISGCLGENRAKTLEKDVAHNTVCNVSGPTLVDRNSALTFDWGISSDPSNSGDSVPLFPFFGFDINLGVLGGNGQSDNFIILSCDEYILKDYDPATIFATSEVNIYDLLGNLVAAPSTNKGLKVEFKLNDIKSYLNIDSLFTCGSIDPEKFIVLKGQLGAKDTVMYKYPTTLSLGYEYLLENKDKGVMISAWNCLNAKGRLVAPGGYIVVQRITALGQSKTIHKKLIVTSKKSK